MRENLIMNMRKGTWTAFDLSHIAEVAMIRAVFGGAAGHVLNAPPQHCVAGMIRNSRESMAPVV
eukprot:5602099-Amphidinium_carterae.2